MPQAVSIALEDPRGPDLGLLHARHFAAMSAETPPGSMHMLPPDGLARPDVAFFVMREAGAPIGMGAFRRLSEDHAEIKSMHILAEARRRGLARFMLDHLMREAKAAGARRASLETGIFPSFAPARALYAAAGFEPCGPFGDYNPDLNSVFMTRTL